MQQPHPPLVLGGTVKPRFAALAARYASEVNTLGAPNDELGERKAALDRACTELGRDPSSLGYSVMTACFVGESRDDVHERIARFLAVRGDDADPAALARSGATAGSSARSTRSQSASRGCGRSASPASSSST